MGDDATRRRIDDLRDMVTESANTYLTRDAYDRQKEGFAKDIEHVRAALIERVDRERDTRIATFNVIDHERELRAVQDDHEREQRLLTEAAVEKARQLQFEVYEERLQNMNAFRAQLTEQAKTFMPIDRFEREHTGLRERYEREHEALIERHQRDIKILADKIEEQERVTVRQDSNAERLEKVGTTQRWMAGILITLAIFAATTILHIWNVI